MVNDNFSIEHLGWKQMKISLSVPSVDCEFFTLIQLDQAKYVN